MNKKYKFLIVISNFYPDISASLLKEATDHIKYLKHRYEICNVKGSLEVPTKIVIKLSKQKFDAVIALGCIIKGKTDHYDLIANAITNALLNISVINKIPISNAILTCKSKMQAKERASKKFNRAKEAVEAAISVLED